MLNRAMKSFATSQPGVTDGGPDAPLARTRFRSLVESPLRAGILRHLSSKPGAEVEIESLMQVFGQIRVDVEHCVHGLVQGGVVRALPGSPVRYMAATPADPDTARQLRVFLADISSTSIEERSPAAGRFLDTIGRDEQMMLIFESIRTVSKTELPVLILGPTGSGKELVARVIHELSARQHEALQTVSCAALPDSLFESEVFGFDYGAFTGACTRKPGRIELARHGTLFLDEVAALSLRTQGKLLRVVEDRRVERLGSHYSTDVECRLICATSRPLDAMVADHRFLEDLHDRINGCTIRLPALRQRPADIPVLADRILARYCAASGLPLDARRFEPAATDLLSGYPWPGNIRELEATVARAALSAHGGVVQAKDIQFLHTVPTTPQSEGATLAPLRDIERDHIRRVLHAVSWNKRHAAQVLEISRETLYRKIAEFGLVQESQS